MHEDEAPIRFLALTQNIGSIDCEKKLTDDLKQRLLVWIESCREFLETGWGYRHPDGTSHFPHDVVVIHLQEIGGKSYNEEFNECLSAELHKIWPAAGWCSGLLMQKSKCNMTFTAMGSIVFVSTRLVAISSILSIRKKVFVSLQDDAVAPTSSQAHLFLGCKFSDADTSRKGFLLTCLRIGTLTVNFVNLHLYHDADNRSSAAASPSEYASRRAAAFREALQEISPLIDPRDPLFMFGDFNTRLDAKALIAACYPLVGMVVVTEKRVEASDAFWEYMGDVKSVPNLLMFDREVQNLCDVALETTCKELKLAEFPITFAPTYAREDGAREKDAKRGKRGYKKQRLPAWCDRVVFNPAGLLLASGKYTEAGSRSNKRYLYDAVSLSSVDHDAVFLSF